MPSNDLLSSQYRKRAPSIPTLMKRGFTPTVSCFNQFLLFLYQNKRFRSIILIFSQLKSNQLNGNSFTNSIFAKALLKERKYDDAVQFLKAQEDKPSILTKNRVWDTLIQGLCVHEKDPEKAVSLLRDCLVNGGALPSSFTLCSLIHCFSCQGKMDKAIEVLEMMTDEKAKYPFGNFVCSCVMSGFVNIGKPELAVGFYENAVRAGALLPNIVTYTALASAYCRMSRIEEVSNLVSRMEKAGLTFDAVFYSCWIYGYFSEGIVEEALSKYAEMVRKKIVMDTIGYTIIIHGFTMDGNVEKAVGFLYKMRTEGLQPNLVTFTVIMLGFCKKGKMNEALAVLKVIEEIGIKADELAYAVLIHGFCRKGDFDRVFSLLDEMEAKNIKPSVGTYNTVINGLCKVGRTSEADEFSTNVFGDAMTYSSLLRGYIKEENVEGVLKTRRRLEVAGICVDVVLCNMLIKAHLMVGSLEEAYEVYKGMAELDLAADSYTYHAMIDGYCKAGRIDMALEIFDELRKASIPSVACYNSIIHGLCMKRMVGAAIDVLTELNDRGLFWDERICKILIKVIFEEKGIEGVLNFASQTKNLGSEIFDITGNIMIQYLCKRGFFQTALDIYFLMKRKRSSISCRSFYSIAKGIICGQNISLARLFLTSFLKECGMFEVRVIKSLVFYHCVNHVDNALKFLAKLKDSIWRIAIPVVVFDTFRKNSRILDAYKLIIGVDGSLLSISACDYSIIIDSLCKGGHIDKGLDLCIFVRQKGISLNIVVYNSIINGLCRQGCLVDAFRLFDSLENHHMDPSEITYSMLIDALSKKGLLQDARNLFERMVLKGFKPNTRIYNSLIHGCCRFGQMEEALKLLLDLEVGCLKPDGFTISAVIDGYCKRGDMEGAFRFFYKFKRKNMKPDFLGFVYLIRGLCTKGRMEESRSILREMLQTRDVVDLMNSVNFDNEMESMENFLVLLCEEGRIQESLTILNEIASIYVFARRNSNTDHELMNDERAFSRAELKSVTCKCEGVDFESNNADKLGRLAKSFSVDDEKFCLRDFDSYYCLIATLCAKGELHEANKLARTGFCFP